MSNLSKTCSKCKVSKSLDSFPKKSDTRDGLYSHCKVCKAETGKRYQSNNRDKVRAANNRWYKATTQSRKDKLTDPVFKEKKKLIQKQTDLKKLYGISLVDYNKLFEDQKGVCSICKNPETARGKSLSVDHDHSTGKVRGLLCGNCNKALGCFRDDPHLILNAISYLEYYEKNHNSAVTS